MAGNIIPAIATTNAVIAGLLIMEAIKILSDRLKACKTVSVLVMIVTYSFMGWFFWIGTHSP